MGELLFLRPNVVIEPLIERWYAWSHLISPATAALNFVGRYLPLMESYLAAPEMHAQAVLNPKLRGGPFVDLNGGKLEDVRVLLEVTKDRLGDLMQLAAAIKALDVLLAAKAKGFGLEDLYREVPPELRGYVELYYDRNNNADFRFFESLLYRSRYYQPASQSVALWITSNDHRPFCLSTPRLDDADVLHLPISFSSRGIDALASMKRTPQTLDFIRSHLQIEDRSLPLFKTFFTNEEPTAYENYRGDRVRLRYFGHACILIETKNTSILLDPLISYYGYQSELNHFSDIDLPPKVDYVLITHNHQDHILFETLLPMRHKIGKVIVPAARGGRLEDPDLCLMFNNLGFQNVIAINEMQEIHMEDISVTGLPFTGEHSDLNILSKSCYLVKIKNFKLLFMADSRVVEPKLYELIANEIGGVDVVFLGMECDGAPLSWLYGPLMPRKLTRDQDGSRRLAGSDCERGMSLVDIFKPKEIYVYAMGQEPWVEFISSVKYNDDSNPIVQSDGLIRKCVDRGIIAERLYGEKEILYEVDD